MEERARSAFQAFRRHPWASVLVDSSMSANPLRLRYFEAILSILCRAGFSLEMAARSFSLLDCYIYGFLSQKNNISGAGDGEYQARAEEFGLVIPEETYPYLARMAKLAAEEGYDERADFEFGLQLILGGLERALGSRGKRGR
jgi:hypothetical protein